MANKVTNFKTTEEIEDSHYDDNTEIISDDEGDDKKEDNYIESQFDVSRRLSGVIKHYGQEPYFFIAIIDFTLRCLRFLLVEI